MRQAEPGADQIAADTYRRLAEAEPEERVLLLLQLIANSPQGRLELPEENGVSAILSNIDVSPAALTPHRESGGETPAWWSTSYGGINLRYANLQGAQLRLANLQQADLTGANLRGARLGSANLHGAILEDADLRDADLAGANLRGASVGKARLQQALLEDADLSGATLRYAQLQGVTLEGATLRGADLWGANLTSAGLEEANLEEAVLRESRLDAADLSYANLHRTVLRSASLRGAVLRRVNLRDAFLGDTQLDGADLRDARLQDLDLTTCSIEHIHLSGARLDETHMQLEQLGHAVGEELAGDHRRATHAYLALETNFRDLGDPDASSWAYRKRRRMQKLETLRLARAARASRRWGAAAVGYIAYSSDQLVEWLCDYGESVSRVLRALLAVYLIFTLLYLVTGSVAISRETPQGRMSEPTQNIWHVALFSLVGMTSPEGATVSLTQSHEYVFLLTGIQTLLSIALTGLLGFVLGNRIRR